MIEPYDVVVLGAGAAGLMCALTAGQQGRRVLVLEKANKIGKKILMSGGGRCNFTNLAVEADNFICSNPHFCKSALSRYTQWDFIALVERHGIEYEERKHGQLFCLHSARDILDMLVAECKVATVDIQTHSEVSLIDSPGGSELSQTKEDTRYRLTYSHAGVSHKVDCASVVVATGALSIPTLGGSGLGYDIASQFNLPLKPRRAGLVPFMFSDAMQGLCERLAGVSLPVSVSCNGTTFEENILFTHRGISGPAILQISNYWHPGDTVSVNLLPDLDPGTWLGDMKGQQGRSRLTALLGKHLPKALAGELQLLFWPDMAEKNLGEFSDRQLASIGTYINSWQLKPSATEGYRTAEVTLGGVDTDHISSRTMEAKRAPGLFFIGEVVDVTGHLGGYNFQWAWSSGYCAGSYA
jgi:predicted Rossmann fold flavoprotein